MIGNKKSPALFSAGQPYIGEIKLPDKPQRKIPTSSTTAALPA
jgi:hypothetical protein